MTSPRMSLGRANDIVAQMMKLQGMQSASTRNIYLREIELVLKRSLAIERDSILMNDLLEIVRGSDREEGGLDALLHVVGIINKGTRYAAEIERLVREWQHERDLLGVLETVDLEQLRSAISTVNGKNLPPDADVEHLVQDIGWHVSPTWGGPAIFVVVDLLDQLLEDDRLAYWMEAVAQRIGMGAAQRAEIRNATASHLQSLDSPPSVVDPDVHADPELEMKRFLLEETSAITANTIIRGGVPPRNEYFTGREGILKQVEATLQARRRASVLPEAALYGYGGVGKTQIAVEYTYRNADKYQLIWWMSAEDPSVTRASLSVLASRLGLPPTGNMDQTVRSVLDALSTTTMSWLLVYDNADDPAKLESLMPSTGGHVLITSRNPEWSASSPCLPIAVFTRAESKEMLRKRHPDMPDRDADRLAETLGDLPLALEQAVTWLLTLVPSVEDYLRDFQRHMRRTLDETKARNYPQTVLAFVAMAVARLRQDAPVAAQLLELIAFLGPEPISTTLLWEGRRADLTEPMRTALQDRNDIARAVRDVGRFGLAKVENVNRRQRVEVHRLVQLVLREELIEERREDAARNARRLLAAANPGYPDDRNTWARHAEIKPHLWVANLIQGDQEERIAIMDQFRYVYNTGDFEGCKSLAEEILRAWDKPIDEGGHGPNDALTLLAIHRYADTLRMLGDRQSAVFEKKALEGMRKALGESHEYTLAAVMGYAADLRIEGDFAQARELDDRNLALHLVPDGLGHGHPSTLRAMNSVAINRRWAGDFQGAYDIDVEAQRQSRVVLGQPDAWTYLAIEGQARDLVGLGRYAEALSLQQSALPEQTRLLTEEHSTVMRAKILLAAMLRKTGQIREALSLAREIHRSHTIRFGLGHPQTIAAAVTYANTLRVAGDPAQALKVVMEAREAYTDLYGPAHPHTLCARLNESIIERALNYNRDALAHDEQTLPLMQEILGQKHPFVIALRVNHSNNLSRAHRLDEALSLSSDAYHDSIEVRGLKHPYTLHAMVNKALDLKNLGKHQEGGALLAEAAADLERIYPPGHPDAEAARRESRLECELEPPLI